MKHSLNIRPVKKSAFIQLCKIACVALLSASYSLVHAQSFPVTISADGPTTFCNGGSVTLSAPLSQTGTTSQLAPNSGTSSDCNCPAGYVVVGIQGRTGFWLDQFSLICQQLSPTGTLFGATVTTTANGTSIGGSPAGPYNLPAGNVMVGGAADYFTYAAGQSYIESIGLKGQTPAYIIANGNNATSPTTATTISGNQTATGSLGTQYAPAGSVITGMRSFDKVYSAGVQWVYTPIAQIMTTYLWSPGGQTTRSILVNSSNTYTLTATAGYGTGSDSKVVTVLTSGPAAPTSFSTFDNSVCQGETGVTYVVNPVATASSYNWSYTGSGETITGTGTSVSVDFSNTATAGNIRVSATNACGTSSNLSQAVTMNNLPGRPGNGVSGASTVCQGQSGVAYTVPTSSGATSYTWTYSGTGGTVNGSTTSITVDFAFNAGNGTLTVYGTNACGNSIQNRNMSIAVSSAPSIPSVVTPSASPCNTSTGTTYTVTNAGGGVTYAWSYSGTGSSITSGSTSNSITVSYSSATNGTWTVTPTKGSCPGPGRTYTTTLQFTGTWLGTTSTVWSAAATTNWGCGTIPAATTDVIIPSGAANMPNIAAGYTATTKSITINPSASLTITSTGGLNVSGNFANSGTFTDNNIFSTSGKVSFVGGTAQSITGTTTFSNLTIANTSGGVTIPAGNATTVNGVLTLSSAIFATNGNLSQNLYTGAIAPGGTGTITGSIRFFKTIWGDRYHYISLPTPTAGITTTEWNDDVVIKSGANSNLYSYNEALPDSNQKVGWTAVAPGATLTAMKGYALFFPRWTYNTNFDVNSNFDNTITSVSSGTLNNTPSTTPVAKPTSDGWQLLGNPFPSTIDWTLVAAGDRTGLNNAIYAYDSRRMLYTGYVGGVPQNGGTQYIGSMQGFFVKVTASGGTGSLVLRNAARLTSTLKDVWRVQGTEDKMLRLTVANGTRADELVVRFKDEATEQFDAEYDGYKLINDDAVPSLFAYTAEANYCVNSLPTTLTSKTIPLQLNVASDTLCTWTANMSGFTNEESITLEDRLLGTSQSLSTSPTYQIQLNKGVYTNRFFLQYSKKEAQVTETKDGAAADAAIDIAAVQQNIVVLFTSQNSGDANIAVFDALGKKVYEAQNVSTASGRVDINFQDINNGIYIVKVQTPAAMRSQQVYLIK